MCDLAVPQAEGTHRSSIILPYDTRSKTLWQEVCDYSYELNITSRKGTKKHFTIYNRVGASATLVSPPVFLGYDTAVLLLKTTGHWDAVRQ